MRLNKLIAILFCSCFALVSQADPYTWTASYSADATAKYATKTVTDPNGHQVVKTSIFGFGSPLLTKVSDQAGLTTTSVINPVGLTQSISQGGLTHSYTYNDHNWLETDIAPELGTTTFTYYPNGQRETEQTNNASKITYTYDATGNPLTTTYSASEDGKIPAASTVTKTYDTNNRLSTESNGIAGYTYTYDANGNMLTAVYSYGGHDYNFTYTYDGNNSLTSITYPDGIKLDYAPDAFGLPSQVKRVDNGHADLLIHDINYSNYKKISSYEFSGSFLEHDFDPMGRISGIIAGTGTPTAIGTKYVDLTYTYDGMNNVKTVTDNLDQTQNRTFGYDAANRMTTANGSWGNGSYTYDNLNNISKYNLGDNISEKYTYNTTNNQLNSVAGTANKAFTYDANGNVISNGKDTFLYNAANQLIKVTGTSGSGQAIEVDYLYDAASHVVSYTETVAGAKKQPVFTIYDDKGDLLYSIDPNKKETKDYIYLDGKQVAISKHATGDTTTLDTSYYVNDALGSPTASINNSGALSWHRHYQPYGKEIENKDTSINHTSFTGKRLYGDIALVNMNARFYDPVVGRFMGYDPAPVTSENLFSFNRYAYANNNPMLYTDPTGLLSWSTVGRLFSSVADTFISSSTKSDVMSAEADLANGVEKSVNNLTSSVKSAFGTESKAVSQKTFQTYTKTNPETGEVYTGRTSGTRSPQQNVAARNARHHMSDKGFGDAALDKSSSNRYAIRGREQQLIDANGGAKSMGGTSGNAINGIASKNPRLSEYINAANQEF